MQMVNTTKSDEPEAFSTMVPELLLETGISVSDTLGGQDEFLVFGCDNFNHYLSVGFANSGRRVKGNLVPFRKGSLGVELSDLRPRWGYKVPSYEKRYCS
jgi:hypothetical protein